jgi:ABC-type transporter Mla subunit MlaD
VERSLGSRIRTVLDVDQTLQRVDSVAADMGPLLESFAAALNDFNATLERFGQSLDRLSNAAETIDATAAKMEPLMNDLTKTLQSLQMVTSPLSFAREGVRRARTPKE